MVIPTYRREQVLLDTVAALLALPDTADEVLVVDQSPTHEPVTEQQLHAWSKVGAMHWLRWSQPSIPGAMNHGLREARYDIVLFLDDDVRPEPGLIAAHREAHARSDAALVAGRVIQPWQEGVDFSSDESFHFASLRPAWVDQFMGGNFSVLRDRAVHLGGFDENFVRVAYRFEAEFAYRLRAAGDRIFYEPAACIHHLKAGIGGTRSYGEHLTTWRPDHSVGEYYYLLRCQGISERIQKFFTRPVRAIATRHHLRHPWWIPVTLAGELAGMAWACWLAARGPRYLSLRAIP